MGVTYNGFKFNDYSNVSVTADMQYDEAERTVLYHKYRLRVESTIYAESNDPSVGYTFRRIRQLLSKAGQVLIVDHAGFGPAINLNLSTGTPRDVAWGPKPRVITWEPVGATNAVEVTWECDFHLPTCEGAGDVRFTGLSALNYTVSWSIVRGYTTRTTSGYLEIAMTRNVGGGRTLPDTADAYRDVVVVPKPYNFERTTQWTLSADKRRADFVITDAQIQSPHPYPPGVMSIRANHRVGWSRRALATLPNTITATIQLVHGRPRGFAWEIFRLICAARIGTALNNAKVFLESLDVDESLYDNSISFSMSYRLYFAPGRSALGEIFSATGLFERPPGDWNANGIDRDLYETHRGIANMKNEPGDDQIVDLCANVLLPSQPSPVDPPPYTPSTYTRFCNKKPPPYESWLRFEGAFTTVEDNPAVQQITIGKDDLNSKDFDPNDPLGSIGDTDQAKGIKRIIESAPAGMEFHWMGYAERVGYDIPRPGKIEIGTGADKITLYRRGEGVFRKKFLGNHFCQRVYGAAWNMKYVADKRPTSLDADQSDPINTPPGSTPPGTP